MHVQRDVRTDRCAGQQERGIDGGRGRQHPDGGADGHERSAIGIALAFRQVIRLFPEIDWVNGFRLADPGLAVERPPVLLAPMAAGAPTGDLRVAIERLREAITDGGSNRAATSAMANLAEAIQGLVHHMRTEQQMIRDWVDSQAEQHREIRRLLELLVRENVNK